MILEIEQRRYMLNNMYDVIIIGKGPAGISASLYISRAGLKTLVIGQNSPLRKAQKIDNYYGFSESIDGQTLLEQGETQAERLGVEIVDEEVVSLEKEQTFKVNTSKGEHLARAVLIATGSPPKTPVIKGAEKFEGNGIHYCASCDGFFYKNFKIGVLGNKDYAVHEAIELLSYTPYIKIFTNNRPLELSDYYCEEIKKFSVNSKSIASVEGEQSLEKIIFNDGTYEQIDGIFVAEGTASSIDFARKLGIITEGTAISVDKELKTNLDGVFAAGDCTGGVKQISTAVGQGAVAGKKIIEYLSK